MHYTLFISKQNNYIIYSSTTFVESHVSVFKVMHNFFALFRSCFVYIDLRILYILYDSARELEIGI